MQGGRARNSAVERAAIPSGSADRPPRRSDYSYLLSVTPGALGVCITCGRCLVRARMSAAAPGANELCGLCEDIASVASAVAASTMSADDEDIARRLLSRVHALLQRHRDWTRGGQRSGPYEAADVGATSVAERVEPASSADAPPEP
jgi:hypothetical protein